MSNKLSKDNDMLKIVTSRPVVPEFLVYISTFLTLVMIASVGVGVYFIYNRTYDFCIVFLSVAVLILLFMIFLDNHYTWCIGGTLSYKDGVLRYDYMEVFNMLGNNKNYYEIEGIEKIATKHKGRYLDIYGDITFKGMYRKPKHVRKCRIYESNDDVVKFIEDKTGKHIL